MNKSMSVRENISSLYYKYGLYIILAVLIIIFTCINPRFFSIGNASNLLLQVSSSGICACGLLFTLLVGGIDISVSSTMYVTAVVSATLSQNAGLGFVGVLLLSILIGLFIGTINGILIAKLKISPLIATLGMQYVIRGIGVGIVGIQTIMFTSDVGKFILNTRVFGCIPLIIVILIIVFAATQYILSRTLFGKQFYAIGNNRHAADSVGIKVQQHEFLAYVICGALAGLAGLLSGAQVGMVSPTFNQGQEFIIISAAVLGGASLFGGKGKAFPGVFIGVLIMFCIENGLVMSQVNMYFYTIVRGIVIFLAVMIDSLSNKAKDTR